MSDLNSEAGRALLTGKFRTEKWGFIFLSKIFLSSLQGLVPGEAWMNRHFTDASIHSR